MRRLKEAPDLTGNTPSQPEIDIGDLSTKLTQLLTGKADKKLVEKSLKDLEQLSALLKKMTLRLQAIESQRQKLDASPEIYKEEIDALKAEIEILQTKESQINKILGMIDSLASKKDLIDLIKDIENTKTDLIALQKYIKQLRDSVAELRERQPIYNFGGTGSGGSGDMKKSTYDPDTDGVIAIAQLDTDVAQVSEIDDTPVNGETTAPISSNWAFDHEAAADPHTGYRLESADHTHQSAGAQAGKLDHGLALDGLTDDDHTQYVLKSLYDAQTILQATSDNTPVALTVAEQTVVGRITGGNITALTVAQLWTLLTGTALGENDGIQLDAALSADGKYSGVVEAGTAGAALAFGDLCYLAVADSRWELADASAQATAFGKLGICVLAAGADGNATTMLLWGKVRADTAFPALTVGAPIFISETAGDIVTTAPVTAASITRIVGYGNTADELYFCPDPTFIEHV